MKVTKTVNCTPLHAGGSVIALTEYGFAVRSKTAESNNRAALRRSLHCEKQCFISHGVGVIGRTQVVAHEPYLLRALNGPAVIVGYLCLTPRLCRRLVDQIRKLMLEHGLTTEDIEAKAKAKREGKAASGAAVSAKSSKVSGSLGSKVPPKYQHPETGATWTGRGSAPAWIADMKDRTKYLIASRAEPQAARKIRGRIVS
jgi:hypothetical protein